jgi:hypothetical protein
MSLKNNVINKSKEFNDKNHAKRTSIKEFLWDTISTLFFIDFFIEKNRQMYTNQRPKAYRHSRNDFGDLYLL